jgi:hypothetical protein
LTLASLPHNEITAYCGAQRSAGVQRRVPAAGQRSSRAIELAVEPSYLRS